ncbi:MAG: Ig-like domain-containing protein, partial [Opitutales bacterium]
VTPGSRVVAKAYVFDEDPEGVTMTFFVNGSQVGTPDTAPPFSVVLEPVGGLFENIYSVTALATDSDGNSRAKTLAPLYISDVSVDHPGVALVSPAPDSILTEGSRASLRAQVVGATANIAEVQFYANGELIGSDSTAPYAIDWLPDQLGAVEITAAVLQKTEQYDHDDNFETPLIPVTPVMVANPVPVTVNPPVGVLPAISFQVLPDQVDLAQGAEIILYADAQDLDGTVASVQFFLDGVPLGMPVTTPPFSVGWIAQGEGIHYLHAVATDNEGNVVNSNFESVEVAPRVISTPSIDLTLPTAASQAGDFITLRSSVRDFVNGPDGVVFYVDGQAVGTSNEKPYNYVWEANLEGTVSVFATARFPLGDGSVVTAASSAQTLTLAADADPVIESFSVSWPGQSSAKPNPLVGEMLAFSVTATDNGHVERLELLRNGETVQLLDVDRSTILLEETPPGLGSYTYSVVVTDNAGRQTASGGLDVTVVLGQPPVLALTAPETGDEYLPGEAITVRATASDADGTVVGVQFFVNGTPVGEVDTVAPYAYTFTPSGAGDYAFTARAEDNSGNFTATPAAVTVEVLTDDPPSFANFGINLEHGDGTQGSPYIVRVGTSFTIDTEASDDQGVRSVALLRNSTEVPAPAGAEVPIQFSDTLDAPGLYGYRAEVIDTGDNVTSSERLYVRAIQGQRPLVTIDQPFDGAQVEVDQSTPIRVTATPADEPQGPLGSIAQVEFRANGTTFATRTQAPYTAGFTPASEGQWEISVVATSDTGINSTEAIATLNAVDEELPEIQSFTNDTTGNQTLFGLPITFEVVASDELGIRRVEFYRMGRTAPLGEASAAPYTFTYTPTALDSGVPGEDDPIPAGTHLFYARAVNAAGVSVDSEPAEINIRHPEPLTLVEDYIFQSYLDFLLRIPTPEERAAAISQFDTSLAPVEQDAAAAVVLDLLDDPEFVPVRSTLLAYELLTGAWPSRADLESGVRLVREAADVDFAALDNTARAAALRQLVQLLLPSYAGDHGSSLPTAASSSSEIDAFTSALWETKYGAPLADPSVARARFRAFGREDFVARFLLDVGLVTSPTGTSYTPVLGFANPPNDRYAEWGVAAAVLGLLRDSSEFAPEQTRVEEYAALLPGERVLRALASDAYRERFEVGDIALVHLEDNWKASSWLGEYMAFDDGWNYHVELGYLYFDMEDARPDGMWYFDLSTGWTWTRGDIVPHVYSHKLQSWLFWVPSDYEASGGQRWFYNYDEAGWRSY